MQAVEAAVKALAGDGVTTMFGVIGDGNFRFAYEAERCGIEYHPANHEAAAVSMADGWARITGRPGVVTVTKGPGLTNTLTAITEAVKANTPLVLLTGDAPTVASVGPQMIDQARLMESVGAGVQRFRTPGLLAADVQVAHQRALRERRPIMLAVPVDLQAREVGDQLPLPATQAVRQRAGRPSRDDVTAIVAAIRRSERPVVLAGWGAYLSGAEGPLTRLAAEAGALLATTATVKGMFADESFCVGVSGGFSSEAVADVLAEADLLLVFGASLNSHTTRHGTLFRDCVVIQIEDRPGNLGVHFTPSVGVVADAAEAARAVLEALESDDVGDQGFRTPDVAARIEADRNDALRGPDDSATAEGTIHARAVMAELNRSLPPSATVVTDGGQFFGFPATYLQTPAAGRFMFPAAFQSMGLGLGFAGGISVGRGPADLTVVVIGDGGMRMTLGEVEALVRIGRPILVVVLNDSAYGAEVHIMGHQDLAVDLAHFPELDFANVGREVGAQGQTVRSVEDLAALRVWLRQPIGVYVLDCKTDPTIPAPFIPGLLNAVRA